jgi:FtsH-binding integral membrane protein
VLFIVSLFTYRGSFLEAVIGLAMGVLYIIIDTQIMIARAQHRKDVFTDAKELFIDLAKIFFEIVKLLSKDEKKDKKN